VADSSATTVQIGEGTGLVERIFWGGPGSLLDSPPEKGYTLVVLSFHSLPVYLMEQAVPDAS
jgi:hypothetical protein